MQKTADAGSSIERLAYGTTPQEAIKNYAIDILGKDPDSFDIKIAGKGGAHYAKRHPFAATITAFEMSDKLREDINEPRHTPRNLDNMRRVFYNTEKGQVQYWDESQFNSVQENIENTIECGEPISRPNPLSPYEVKRGDNGTTTIQVPNQNNLPCKEKLVPECFQEVIDRHPYADNRLIDSYIRAIKNEPDHRARTDRAGPLNRQSKDITRKFALQEKSSSFFKDIDNLYENLCENHKDAETEKIKDNLKLVFGTSKRTKAADEKQRADEEKTSLPPTTSMVMTENPAIANRYRMLHSPSGDLLLSDPTEGTPFIRVSHTKIRTLHTTDESITHSIALAKEKNWPSIKISGTKDYRQRIWLEAQSLQPPLKVSGYKPTDQDLTILALRLEANTQNTLSATPEETPETQTEAETQAAPTGQNNNSGATNTETTSDTSKQDKTKTPKTADQGYELD